MSTFLLPSTRHARERQSASRPRQPAQRLLVLAQAGLRQLWRPRRANRHDACGTGGKAALDFRAAFPARAQLLHAAAGTGSDPAGHLHRLADAPHARRPGGGPAVFTALAAGADRPVLAVHGVWPRWRHRRRPVRHQAGRCRHRAGGRLAPGPAHLSQPRPDRHCSGRICRHRRATVAISTDRAQRRPAGHGGRALAAGPLSCQQRVARRRGPLRRRPDR
ncbi:hypothetical protein D3C72_1013080 [compost metagenome]